MPAGILTLTYHVNDQGNNSLETKTFPKSILSNKVDIKIIVWKYTLKNGLGINGKWLINSLDV